jgi:inosine-uridine nucleoside N-ribohydrolase
MGAVAENRRPTAMRILACLLVLAAALAAGCGSSRSAQPVVVDTDLGSDDVIAILYLLRNPAVDVRAITVSGTGLVHCPGGARNAAALLGLAGREDVPVACGAGLPLRGLDAVPEDWRNAADGLFGLELPPVAEPVPANAVSLLRREAPGSTVLELAPMTNLAGAIRAEPELARKTRVVAMGGAIAVPGNAPGHPAAETNAWLDPEAIRVVLRSGVPLTLVPLDATNHVPVTPYIADALRRYHYATAEATVAWDLVNATGMGNGGTYFWDPLAAVAVVDPPVLDTGTERLDVASDGRTVAAGDGTSATVATGADRARFERDLVGTLLGGAPFTIERRPTGTIRWNGETCTYTGPRRWTAGTAAIDTVNTGDRSFQYVVGEIEPPHDLADLQALIGRLPEQPKQPSWFRVQAGAWVPPHSEMTWTATITSGTSGSVVVGCSWAAPPYAAVAATLPVYAAP